VSDRAPLLLVQQIPLLNVGGRIDHFTFEDKRKRVIGAALGNNTVEVVDTFAGRDVHSISGRGQPWLKMEPRNRIQRLLWNSRRMLES
jgi:hypothetical protein